MRPPAAPRAPRPAPRPAHVLQELVAGPDLRLQLVLAPHQLLHLAQRHGAARPVLRHGGGTAPCRGGRKCVTGRARAGPEVPHSEVRTLGRGHSTRGGANTRGAGPGAARGAAVGRPWVSCSVTAVGVTAVMAVPRELWQCRGVVPLCHCHRVMWGWQLRAIDTAVPLR